MVKNVKFDLYKSFLPVFTANIIILFEFPFNRYYFLKNRMSKGVNILFLEVFAIGLTSLIFNASLVSGAQKESFSVQNIEKNRIKKEKVIVAGFADNSINDSTYLIGGGDEFLVALIENPSIFYSGSVNQNGDLFLPELGIVPLGRIPLYQAKLKISGKLEEKLTKKVYVSLNKVKTATITVNGAVSQPGTYTQPGTLRILDLISIANYDTLPSIQNFNFRAIVCTNRGDVKKYDLYKYLFKGDQSQNPYIYPGDELMLERVNCNVFLSGDILSLTGWVPITPDEKVCDFINLFQYSNSADLENVIIQRNSTNGPILHTVNCKTGDDFTLQNRDVVIVTRKKGFQDLTVAKISGEALRTGVFPIIKGSTTAEEIIEMAGGTTKHGDLSRAVILRRGKNLPEGLSSNEIRPEINSAVDMMSVKKDYSVIRLNDLSVVLEPDDQIFIPKIENMVFISGGVKTPGGVQFKKGMDVKYYIENSGGMQRRADKFNIFVVTTYDDIMVTKDKGNIEEGDIIVVPISQQNKTLSTIILPIISAASTTLGVLLAIYTTVNAKK